MDIKIIKRLLKDEIIATICSYKLFINCNLASYIFVYILSAFLSLEWIGNGSRPDHAVPSCQSRLCSDSSWIKTILKAI